MSTVPSIRAGLASGVPVVATVRDYWPVCYWSDLIYDPELLYTAAMFHDLGLTARFGESQLRFEVDGANAARDFLRSHGIPEADIGKVWTAIALHTTPGIPEFLHPEAALLHVGAGMDVAGRSYDQFSDEERAAVIATVPGTTTTVAPTSPEIQLRRGSTC